MSSRFVLYRCNWSGIDRSPLCLLRAQDIFRKYPNRYESIIAELCDNLDTLDEPEAKACWFLSLVGRCGSGLILSALDLQASMIWIIGEYADRIDNAPQLLEGFVETFDDENPQVRLSTFWVFAAQSIVLLVCGACDDRCNCSC